MSSISSATQRGWLRSLRTFGLSVAAIVLGLIAGYSLLRNPSRGGLSEQASVSKTNASIDHEDNGHEEHDHSGHDHSGHDESHSIELNAQTRANLRLQVQEVQATTYTKYVEVPGIVTQWPGKTHVAITSPLTGVINAIYVSRGQLIRSGDPMFRLRLTHQDLVQTQEAFLTQLGQLDVEDREIRRLSDIASSGAVPGKTRLAREYEREKLLAGIRAAKQSMLLHGLTEDQINEIERSRTLIRELVVRAPWVEEDNSLHHEALGAVSSRMAGAPEAEFAAMQPPQMIHDDHVHIDAEFVVSELDVHRGESVTAGQRISQISDFSQLLIEGQAYQRDSKLLRQAATTHAEVQAVLSGHEEEAEVISGLNVIYIGNEVRTDSRSLAFYVGLKNQVEHDENRGRQRYVSWRFKPGQRLTVRLPVSKFNNAIVVPRDAVAEEGPERFVFVENGDHFDRVPVEVMARDSLQVAIRNDGQLWPGQRIASRGAHQLQMALKNQGGGAIDPHAGHNH
ncbi:efflux RND transporter periplasmic adaptor subunit [Rhodopirellula sp. JC740]|uniref:Efflux RND transporter periplasmic adaptor subunit n=1 Tax=Rhodopirellula halodulae TaxID=2894198 RepID=A0ABS8NIB4_9BACT|nr:efflux RND transporter periplasmic adaptor subunit [Rhodopirellula sp. JC740]MCC9643300.1 efflux RND transporter periplasmic adaptor subunit [Rhodopirellula sp. JC740]